MGPWLFWMQSYRLDGFQYGSEEQKETLELVAYIIKNQALIISK